MTENIPLSLLFEKVSSIRLLVKIYRNHMKHGKETTEREKYRGDFVGIGQQTAGVGGAVGVQTCGVEPDIPQICIRPLCRATR